MPPFRYLILPPNARKVKRRKTKLQKLIGVMLCICAVIGIHVCPDTGAACVLVGAWGLYTLGSKKKWVK